MAAMVDWVRAERLYRQGEISTREIARHEGVQGWKRDVATASARQWDVFFGFFVPGGKR